MTEADTHTSQPKKKGIPIIWFVVLSICATYIWLTFIREPGEASFGDSRVTSLSAGDFQQRIASGVHVVDFWAEWCEPCRTQGPIMETLARRLDGKATVVKVNADDEGELAKKYLVQAIPTIIIFKDGREARRFVGVTETRTLAGVVEKLL